MTLMFNNEVHHEPLCAHHLCLFEIGEQFKVHVLAMYMLVHLFLHHI